MTKADGEVCICFDPDHNPLHAGSRDAVSSIKLKRMPKPMLVVFSANIEISIPEETASAFTWRMRQDFLRHVEHGSEAEGPSTPEDAFFEFLDTAIHGQGFNAAAEYGVNLDLYIPGPSKRTAAKVDAAGRPLIRGTLVQGSGRTTPPKARGRKPGKA